jgi:hypothetical protein
MQAGGIEGAGQPVASENADPPEHEDGGGNGEDERGHSGRVASAYLATDLLR